MARRTVDVVPFAAAFQEGARHRQRQRIDQGAVDFPQIKMRIGV
jgi:hypothetical protein